MGKKLCQISHPTTKNAWISVLAPSEFRAQLTVFQAITFIMLHNFQILGKNG